MKKMFLILGVVMIFMSTLFANSFAVSNFEKNGNSLQAISVSEIDKTIYMDYVYPSSAIVNETNLKKAEEKLVNIVCQNPQIRNKVLKGYTIDITYMYKGGTIIHYKINSCPM
jgi:hypothetical protein